MTEIKVAVVGAGRLGAFHARLLSTIDGVNLVAVVDPLPEQRQPLAQRYGAEPLAGHEKLIGEIDAAIVAAPTSLHCEIALDLLAGGTHLLVEKPVTATVEEADRLVEAARRKRLILQVGHVERFNPAFAIAEPFCVSPRRIEAVRNVGYSFRSTDVGAVLDLMIHDIDIALALTRSEVVDVRASGQAIVGPHEDAAEARLTFANGCVAVLSASRVSFEPERRLRAYCDEAIVSVDFNGPSARLARPGIRLRSGDFDAVAVPPQRREALRDSFFADLMPVVDLPVEPANALLEEQLDFLTSIRSGAPPRVTGRQGRDAVAVAYRVLDAIAAADAAARESRSGNVRLERAA